MNVVSAPVADVILHILSADWIWHGDWK